MKEFHIKKVIASSSEAASVAGNGLNNPANNPTIYVPVGTAALYKEAWSQYNVNNSSTNAPMIQDEPNS